MQHNCPKCQSPDWKSAKLVVLEGTTKSEGSLNGELVEKGAFSGGVREFLLSDRWFSFESPINAVYDSMSRTGLVDEVKNLLVQEGAKRPFPQRPEEPELPKKPGEQKPEPPKMPRDFLGEIHEFKSRTGWQIVKRTVVWNFLLATLFSLLLLYFFPHGVEWLDVSSYIYVFLSLFVVGTLIDIKGWRGREEDRHAAYKNKLAKLEDKSRKETDVYNRAMEIYPSRLHSWQRNIDEFNEALREYPEVVEGYEQELREYEVESLRVARYREELWERARVCTRCGNVYLGPVAHSL